MLLENLPAELWFHILSYLSPLDAFYAFDDISNVRINYILHDMYSIRQTEDNSFLKLNISLTNIPLFMYNFAVANVISLYSNVIYSLTLSNAETPNAISSFIRKFFLKSDFPNLKFLHLIEPTANEFNTIINDLSNVNRLNVQSKSMHTFDVDTIKKVLYSAPSLKNCCFSQFHENFILKNSYSWIEKLVIDSCDYLCFISILNHFTLLEKLSINRLSMSHNTTSSPMKGVKKPTFIKDLRIRAFSIPFNYLQMLFPYFADIEKFSLSIVCDEGLHISIR